MSSDGLTPPPVPPAPPAPPAPPSPAVPPLPPNPNSSKQDGTEGHVGGKTPHHISDIDTWKHPDRNYFVFVILSVLLGLLGVDHFYLRSFHTGMMKLIFNVFTLGMWHYWDLIQIVYDGKKIRKEGLTSPFDWICGIGRGVFMENNEKPKFVAEKSYLVYAALAIFFGFLGADKFYMGDMWQGIAKVLSVFNIFLFLFGFLWVLWDSIHALFMTKSILENGISAPLPYSIFFREPIDGKKFLVTHPVDSVSGGFNFEAMIPTIPIPTISYKGLYNDLVVPFMTPTVVAAIHASKSADEILKTPEFPDAPTMPGLAKYGLPTSLPKLPETPSVGIGMPISQAPAPAPAPASAPASAPAPAANPSAPPTPNMKAEFAPTPVQAGGGARNEFSAGPGPAIAGVLTAVVIAGGLKGFYDIISNQYG